MNGTPGPTRAEQHLGDRLAALVDGELSHDARERVLAHLATCQGCKAEADAQRRVKSVFADTAPPPPSEGLLVRLQGLPVSAQDPHDPQDAAPGGRAGRPRVSPLAFSYFPGGDGPVSLLHPERGFPVHRPPEPERGSAPRGRRRFAFVAAGAFSVAAFALGGALGPGATGGGSPTSSTGPGTAPLRPTAGVERPAERRNETAGQAVVPVRQGPKGPVAAGGPTASAVSTTARPPHRTTPQLPPAAAPGIPHAPLPPPSLRAPHLHHPSPAPGTAPLAISRR
ncbi:zf-HC2 domain-containing protein [Streptomyces sp. GSL17-111]|uniref:zf-HC2 domain-containing protein n=1 Tax=Streptomyces sp. GSL17-111 TaxID=3121596 RepID=UPI0030F4A685